MGHVVVVGSINADMVVAVPRLPVPGETILGGIFSQHFGGKGANQAVAAARVGARVSMIGAVGDDQLGERALEALERELVNIDRVRRVPGPTGVALVMVGPRGENQIAVAPGANAALTEEEAESVVGADVVISNFEVPVRVAVAAIRGARLAGAEAILDPAPAHALPAALLELGPILTPNEHELVVAIGNDDPTEALAELANRSAGPVIVTQGAAGALLARGSDRQHFPGYPPLAVVDTTGAGDTFVGVLAARLAEKRPLSDAIQAANAAAALCVSQPGARGGMPTRSELDAFIGR